MNTIDIDAAAEREAIAIETMAEWLDTPLPETRLQRAIREARTAASLGLPAPAKAVYRWAQSCEAHRRLETASMARLIYGLPASKRVPETDGDKIRRAEKRLARAAKLLKLKFVRRDELLDIDTAVRLSGIGRRTIERAVAAGKIPAVRLASQPGRKQRAVRVRAGDLRKALANRLAGVPIAA